MRILRKATRRSPAIQWMSRPSPRCRTTTIGHQSVDSRICTDPLYGGRGYAGAIIRELVTSMLNRGLSPILHLSPANARAHHLYQSLGFVDRAALRVVKVTA